MSNPSSGSRGYPPPPPPPRSSFLTHHLPPPVPSATSPHSYTSPGASGATGLGSGSHGDTSVWSSERDRPVSRSRWSPVLPTLSGERADRDRDRPGSAASSNARLPSFEYPHNNSSNRSSSHWDQHSPSSSYVSGLPNPPSVPQWATANRNTSSPYMRSRSPAKPPTPLSTNEYYHRPSSSHHIPQPYIPHNPLTSRQSYTVDASEDSGATHAGHDESPRQGYGGHSKHDLDVAPSPDDAARNGNSGQKKKKRRVALSCAECAKRKQKCNRETPCQHCVARRVPELCVPYTRVGSPPPRSNKKPDNSSNSNRLPQEVDQLATEHTPNHGRGSSVREASVATSAVAAAVAGGNAAEVANAAMAITAAGGSRPPSMLPTLSVRVSRIEALLNAVVNRVGGLEGKALSDWRINHAPATTPPPIDFALPKEEGEGYRPETSSTLSRPRTAGRDSVDVEGSGDEVAGLDMDSSIRNPLPQSMLRGVQAVPLGLDYHGTPAEQLQKLFKECGLSPDKVHELMRELPDEEYANRLIDWFFAKFNFVRYPIDEIVFRRSMDELYASPAVNARSVLSLPLIFIAFSIAIRIAPDEWNLSEEEKRVQSLKMYWNSKSAITIAQAVKAENVQLVETRILTGLYLILMHERRLAEGWAEFRHALTVGQAIGLHRDGLKLRLDPYSTEYRRLLWSYLIHADATYSCLLGRPTSIDMRFCDTRPPSNVDLADVIETRKIEPRPLSEPTFATYAILRRGLGEIVAKITQHFQRLEGETQYRDVEAIDSSLKTFVDNLPPTFTMLDPDRSYDEKLWYLPIHRYYIQTEILHFTIILHRPWLLRKLRSSRYNLSRNACFQAASTDFRIREAFKKDVPDFFETLLASSFREFNVAMIAGISIILDPRAPHAKDMRAILQNFTEQHPHDSSADDFSQKEAAIIATLYRRAKDLEEQRFSRPMSSSRIGGTLDNISSERTEPYPQPRRHSLTGGNSHNGVNMSGGVQSANHSPVKSFWSRNSPLMQQSGRGSIASIAGTSSPDEDQPQQLLDHWFMSNTSFGPPLSSLDPTQMVSMSGPVYNPSLLMGDSVMQDVPLNPSAPGWDAPLSSGEMLDANGVPVMNGQGMMPHPDQSLAPPGAMGVGYDVNRGMTGPVNGQMGQGGQWGDGNSVQYWNTLVDRIASGIGIDYGVGITS